MSEGPELLRQVVLRMVQHCPQCQHPFSPEDVGLFGRLAETWLFALRCPACHAMTVVGLAVAAPGEPPAMLTPGGNVPPLSEDDVLEMRRLLEDFRGDFRALLKQG